MSNFERTKQSCYFSYIAMASVFSLPPLLFVTFREMYNISYTLLGTLVLINFCTQLIVDLIFTFFTKYFNIRKTVRTMPLLTSIGLIVYAVVPNIAPQYAYFGLVTGTVIFSVSAGLSEVLISPLVATIPSNNPERDMSRLHSLYAYGVLIVVIVSTIFLNVFGRENWMYLTLFWSILPIISFVLFCKAPIPKVNVCHNGISGNSINKRYTLFLCVICIFLGSAAENTMTNWISGYMEKALFISKRFGDILGMASFAVLLGIGRTLYAKYGRNIVSALLWGMIGAAFCYIVAGISSNNIISLFACIFTGLFTSMLWPGTLIMMEEKLPCCGITAYALMAAGGDFGASVSPQMMGIVVDRIAESKWASDVASCMSVSVEQVGMRMGLITTSIFPIIGIIILISAKKHFSKYDKNSI